MVFYFESTTVDPPALIYMGKDKFENESLIKHALPIDIWFHCDKLSSAHVYLRLPPFVDWESIPTELLDDCAQLTKANSIEGSKRDNVGIVYTPAENLKKTGDMDVGQVGFRRTKQVKKVLVKTKINAIVNRLNKTKREEHPDLELQKIQYEKEQRRQERERNKESEKREKEIIREKQKLKQEGYGSWIKEEHMYSNKGHDLSKSVTELEEDFM
jgi:hypothetical protein